MINSVVFSCFPCRIGKGVEARSSLSSKDKRMVNTGIQCGKPPLTTSTCTNQQRRSVYSYEFIVSLFSLYIFSRMILQMYKVYAWQSRKLLGVIKNCVLVCFFYLHVQHTPSILRDHKYSIFHQKYVEIFQFNVN